MENAKNGEKNCVVWIIQCLKYLIENIICRIIFVAICKMDG